MARVAVSDASAATRAGLRLALEGAGLEVCADASSARALVDAAVRTDPDLVVLPLDLPGDALGAIEELARAVPAARTVVLTDRPDGDELVAAVLAGASGYLGKDVGAARLPPVLLAVLAGEAAIPRRLSDRVLRELRGRHELRRSLTGALQTPLTDREWDVAKELRDGHGTAEIARRLRISDVTVRRHISSLVGKLGVRDRRTAVALIRGRGAVPAR